MITLLLALASAEPDGAALYAEHCAGCHGKTGKATFMGRMAGTPSFLDPEFWTRPVERFPGTIAGGGEAAGLRRSMPAYADRLTDAERAAVLTIVEGFRPSP